MAQLSPKENLKSFTPSGKGQVINTLELSGPEQMAADISMLEQASAEEDLSISIRFYKWKGVWLSIGKNQKNIPKEWIKLMLEKKLNIVRRPSGGSAVLHLGGLTYSLVWKAAPRKKLQSYFLASQWLINCFTELGMPLVFGRNIPNYISGNCFQLATQADLIDLNGYKRIGSAQFWRNGNLLQHGEILLDPPQDLWQKLFSTAPPKPAPEFIPRENLDKLLTTSLENYWPQIFWQKKEFNKIQLREIVKKSPDYIFLSDLDINPEEIIPSTSLTNDIPKG